MMVAPRRKLARLDFEHVTGRRFVDEIGRFRSDAERRIGADLFCRLLGERGG